MARSTKSLAAQFEAASDEKKGQMLRKLRDGDKMPWRAIRETLFPGTAPGYAQRKYDKYVGDHTESRPLGNVGRPLGSKNGSGTATKKASAKKASASKSTAKKGTAAKKAPARKTTKTTPEKAPAAKRVPAARKAVKRTANSAS